MNQVKCKIDAAARFHSPGHHTGAMKSAIIDEAFTIDIDEQIAEER
jgi:hypothetical protein